MDIKSNKGDIAKKDRNLLSLAVKCRFISTDQEKDLLTVFIEEQGKNPEISILQIFREKKILSKENIEFLLAVNDHLKTNMLDKKFGALGIANKFINPENVKKALDLQNDIFKKTQKSVLIGDILLEQKEITKANKAAILLTQDRVQDEYLLEAINDIAATEMERISINMRFGAIAVKKRIISLDQLNQALKVQKDEEKSGKPKRYLGDILKEIFNLSPRDLTDILKIQKEFEKQRLSLEKALSQYSLETNTNKRLNRLFEYRFLKNKFQAYISIVSEMTEEILVSDVINWLKSIGIIHGICQEKSIEAFLSKGKMGSEIKIAQGDAPTEPINESVEFLFNTRSDSQKNAAGSQSVFVKKGDILARITPYQEGTPGKDVCGFNIPPSQYEVIPLSCGNGVVKKENLFLAEIDGNPALFKNRTLFVSPNEQSYSTENLSGLIKTDLGTQYETTNLQIDGSIEPGGKVICHAITVKGDVSGAISSGGSVLIEGNVICKSSSKDQPVVISSGDTISINKRITNATIITAKNLMAPNSDLVSSRVYAFQDVVLKNIYSDEGSPCQIQIGKNPSRKANAINKSIDEKKQNLKKLLHKDELDEIDAWFNGKINMQNNYLEQQTILQELLKLFSDHSFDQFETFDAKTTEFMKRNSSANTPADFDIKESAIAEQFIQDLLNDTQDLPKEKQKEYIREMLEIKSGMYRAAVNATRRYQNEYDARKGLILKKSEAFLDEINEIKQDINDLYTKKDYLKLSESRLVSSVNPTIRVKNQVEKGTIIKGRESSIVLDQTIFGVKFSEQKKAGQAPQIIIEGFYE